MKHVKKLGPILISLGLLAASSAVLADEMAAAPPAKHDEMMKHCMKKMKMDSASKGASESDMKMQCEADIKSGKVNDGVVNDATKKPTTP